jgi:hypothetical protein
LADGAEDVHYVDLFLKFLLTSFVDNLVSKPTVLLNVVFVPEADTTKEVLENIGVAIFKPPSLHDVVSYRFNFSLRKLVVMVR